MFKNPDHSKDYVYAEIYHKNTIGLDICSDWNI